MNIHIDSWQSAMVFMLTAIAVFSVIATLHWKIFAEPLLRKILAPYGERLEAVTYVVRAKYPQDFREALENINAERPLRSA